MCVYIYIDAGDKVCHDLFGIDSPKRNQIDKFYTSLFYLNSRNHHKENCTIMHCSKCVNDIIVELL